MEPHNNTKTVPQKAKAHTVPLAGMQWLLAIGDSRSYYRTDAATSALFCGRSTTLCKLLVKAKVFYNTDNVGMRVLNFGINAHVCHLRVISLTVTLEFVIRGGTKDIRAFLATELVS